MINCRKGKSSLFNIILAVLVGVLVIAVIAFIFWMKQDKPKSDAPLMSESLNNQSNDPIISPTIQNNLNDASSTQNMQTKFETGLEDLPRSLQGTDVDGEIIIDENKNLVVTNGLRRLFDYFLSARGQETDQDILARIEAYIRARVPQPAQDQAIVILNQYVAYLKHMAGIKQAGGKLAENIDINLVIKQKQQVANIQKKYFDEPTIKAFFGAEAAYDDYNIELFKIQQDSSLTPEQKQAAELQALQDISDPQLKSQLLVQQNYSSLFEQTKKLKEQNATPQQIRELRERLVGAEAADRLEQVDKRQAAWQQRVQAYLDERAQIQNSEMSDYEKQLAIKQIKNSGFTELEQKRLLAYEQVGTANIN